MLSGNTTETSHMTLRLVPEVLDPVDMVSGFDKFPRVINATMSEPGDIQSVITENAISIDNAVRLYCLSNDRKPCILPGVRNDNDVRLAASLEQPQHPNFASRAASALPFPGAASVAFVDVHLS